MKEELYFIPLLTEAFQSPDPRQALRESFRRIREMGDDPRYMKGYRQFQQLMERAALSAPDIWEEWVELESSLNQKEPIELLLKKGEEILLQIPLGPTASEISVGNLTPGTYQVALNTGRVLWEDKLTEKDLLWSNAFPESSLPLAADTKERDSASTREFHLLNGAIGVRIIPGLESGRIRLEYCSGEK